MSIHDDTVVDQTPMSPEAGGSGDLPPRRPRARSYAGLAFLIIAIEVAILSFAVLRPIGESGASPAPSDPAASAGSPSAMDVTLAPSPIAVAPTPTLSPDAKAARAVVDSYVAGIRAETYDQSWALLSDWSKRSIGSFETFYDAERRNVASRPNAPEIDAPTHDPSLFGPTSAGARASDLAKATDPELAFVIPVHWPESAGVPASTQNLVVAPVKGKLRIWLDVPDEGYGVWPYPAGCGAFGLSARRCDLVVKTAAEWAQVDRAAATSISLLADPGCGDDALAEGIVLCKRSGSLTAVVRFALPDRDPVEQAVGCGVGPPSLLCSDTPGLWAYGMSGYWDVPCSDGPNGCPKRIVPPKGAAAAGARPLRIAALDVPVGAVGHHEVSIGTAVLPGGVLSKGEFVIPETTQQGYLIEPGIVRMEIRSLEPGAPPFDNIYLRGVGDQPETVDVLLVYDVLETSPDATFRVTDVLVR